ncbi:adenosylcobinamide-GDP ribazoletransferase [Limnoglobus roseus]|uniref:Adenosylcobinamide-GDP ribazoletransferase n=1 Tax=Limnoglobus roseus TaxID=2598579 RepID=A0A5C1AJQ2_9BACT|nr:adenosylcobinamide-GDP ribazoletransferase [Limnoglobus roseus]QEL18236.1 adenosylcobinamide-GDP ribazoletransferase [Limnoglobus roseus]
MTIRHQWHAAVTAVQFLTRVPLPGGMNRPNADPGLLKSAVVYFPLIGALVGAFTGGIIGLTQLLWPALIAVVLGLIVEALLTGGFHEDAVADCCDAFGGGWSREDVLRIMKDSRIGSFGGLGLILAVTLRTAGLLAIPPEQILAVAIAAGTLGRWAALLLMSAIPPVTNRDGLAKDVGQRVGWPAVAVGLLLAVPGVVGFAVVDPIRCSAAVIAVGLMTALWGWYVRRRLGGVTGDCLGAGCYFAQLVVLLAATARPII